MALKVWGALAVWALTVFGMGSVALAGEHILTVNNVATGESTEYSDSDLIEMSQTSFKTTTIWTDGVKTFSGPTLKAVLEATGVAPSRLRVYAINDYNVEFPAADIREGTPILANRIDGAPFSVREKGPLWIVFPYDQDVAFQSEDIYSLSVWQVNRIDILGD